MTELLRELAADFLVMAAKDTNGRRQFDPIFEAVTEKRQGKGYSACGDLGHWMLFRLGFRCPWINRGEFRGWRVQKNLNLLCGKHAGGANTLARRPEYGMVLDAGDVLVVNARDRLRAHVAVVMGVAPVLVGGHVHTAEYGQFDADHGRASGRTFVREFRRQGSTIMLNTSTLDSVLVLEGLAEHDPAHVAPDDPLAYFRAIADRQRLLRLLQPNMRGNDVKWWCEELIGWGYSPGLPLEIYGRKADQASTAFQERHGLLATGRMGPDEWALMLGWRPSSRSLEPGKECA